MFSRHQILYSLVLCLLMQKVLSQESPEFAEEYIDEDLPESSVDEEAISAAKATNDTNDSTQKKGQNFADDRFTKLFQPRNRNQNGNGMKPSPFLPKYAQKAKPTLPSFIKKAPTFIKVTPSTQSPIQNQRFNQRATSTTLRTTTTRTPSRGSNANNLNNRRNGLQNNRQSGTSTTASPSGTTADPLARRRFGSGNRRFNANATIPATTSRPRRN